MLTLIITPRRGLYPSLACFEEDNFCYDYRGRRVPSSIDKQVVCFNYGVIDRREDTGYQNVYRRATFKSVIETPAGHLTRSPVCRL